MKPSTEGGLITLNHMQLARKVFFLHSLRIGFIGLCHTVSTKSGMTFCLPQNLLVLSTAVILRDLKHDTTK